MAIPIVSVTANPNPAESSNNTADSNLPVPAPAPAIGLEPNTAPTFRTPGRLDPTFGANGIVTTDFGFWGDRGTSVVLQPDGKLVVVGQIYNANTESEDFELVRYNSDGSFDTSFGTDGKVATDFGNSDSGNSIALQPDGKLVVAGWVYNATTSNQDFGLSRYNPDGSLDTTFGIGGRVTTDFGQDDEAYSIALQPDGKLVVAGRIHNPNTDNWDFGLSRYNSDGSLDTTFGIGGKVASDFGQDDEAYSIALQPDGKLVAVGRFYNPSTYSSDFGLSRYNPDGSLDTTFGIGGKVTTDFGGFDSAYSTVVQPDGKLVAVGRFYNPTTYSSDFGLTRYNSDGSLDTTFGIAGRVTTDFGQDDEAYGVAVQPDGKLVAVGQFYNPSTYSQDFGLSRYNPDGSLDTTFGIGGKVTINSGYDEGRSVVVQPDGKLVVAGSTNGDFALLRYVDNQLPLITINIDEDPGAPSGAAGTLVSSLASLGVTVSDPDVGAVAGIAITAADTTNGKWFYSIDDGSSWNPLGAVSNSSARLLAADDKTRIYFQSNENLNGTLADIATYHAWDQTSGSNGELADVTSNGGTTAFSNTTSTFTIAVKPIDDAPILSRVELSVTEGDSVVLSTDDFDIVDSDDDSFIYHVRNARGGHFQLLSNGSWSKTDSFTTDDIAHGNVRFLHFGSESVPSFQIEASGSPYGASSNVINGTVNFTSVNDAPIFMSYGSFDLSFGTNGIVTTDFGGDETSSRIVVQPDGRLVAVGRFYNSSTSGSVLSRYNPDGSLDPSFGIGGVVTTDFGSPGIDKSIAVQTDDKLIVIGQVYNLNNYNYGIDFGLSRYNPDGSLDTTFGVGGKVTTSFSSFIYPGWLRSDSGSSVAIQPDGKVIAVGWSYQQISNIGTYTSAVALSRYNIDGSLDTSFGVGGIVKTFGGSGLDFGFDVVIQPDGKLVVADNVQNDFFYNIQDRDFRLIRYNIDGSLDSSFATDGIVDTDFGGDDHSYSVALQLDGKLVAAGSASGNIALSRYNSDGSLDATFGIDGKVTSDFGGDESAADVVVQPDGKIVVAGSVNDESRLIRYNADGSLDTTFGIDGTIATVGTSVILQPDGNLVVVGFGYNSVTNNNDFVVARHLGNPIQPITVVIQEDAGAPIASVGMAVSALVSLSRNVLDPDAGALTGMAITSVDTSNGTWFYSTDNGSNWNLLGDVSTSNARLLAADASNRLYFQPNANFNGTLTNAISFHAWDQTTGSNGEFADVTNNGGITAFSNTTNTFTIAVAPVNDPPVLNRVKLSVTEGGSAVLSTDDFDITDPDNNIVTYSAQNVRGGNFQILTNGSWVSTTSFTKDDIANGNVRFVHSGNDSIPSFQIQANDGMLGIMSNVIDGTVNFTSVNDAPIFNSVGNFDSSFGINGIVTTDFGGDETGSRTVLQSDGKLVVVGTINGDFGLSRYNSDGSLELNFGTGGVVTTDFGGSDRGSNIVLQPDGKVIVIGRVDNPDGYSWDFGLSRYNLDGSLDTTFGTGGKVITDFRMNDTGSSAVLQSDGKLVVAGWSTERFTMCCYTSYSVLNRYNSDGSLDTSFGVNGQVLSDGAKNIVTIQPDGKLIVAYNSGSGLAYAPPPPSDFWLSRYNVDGSLDTSFGLGGTVTPDFSGDDSASDITLQVDGKLVVVGSLYNSNTGNSDVWLRRYNPEGSLDTTFGIGGIVTTDFGDDESAADVVVQPDGKLVVAGSVNDKSRLIRYNADGSLDTTFGIGGTAATVGTSVILQPDGNLVVVGSSYNPVTSNNDFVVARHLGNPVQPMTVIIQEDAGAPIASVGMAVSALVSLSRNVLDPDVGALTGMAITSVDTSNGTWFYSTDNGSNWNLLGSVSTSNARLLAADANTRLYFQSNANFNGTLTNAISFHAWDQTTGSNGALADITNNGGTTAFSGTTNSFNLNVTSGENEATGNLSVTGVAAEGDILKATLAAVVDFDGSTTTAYQWQENINGTWINIAEANTETLNIPADQSYVGKNVRVVATTTDAMGGTTDFISGAYAIANVDDEATGNLSITGVAVEGGSLTAALTNVLDPDGNATTGYQWQQDINGTWTNIVGANAAILSIPADQSYVGKNVRVVATTTDVIGGTTDFMSEAYAIANVNDAPIAGDDAFILDPAVPLVLSASILLSNDVDAEGNALSLTAIDNVVGGSASLANGNVIFTLNPNTFDGRASFDYTVSDGEGGADIGSVALSLNKILMLGTDGSDALKVTKFDEAVFARAGDDTIKIKENRSVNDYLFAGDGIDTIKLMGDWIRFANFNARTSSIEIIDGRGKDIRGNSTDNVFDFSAAQLLKVRYVKLKEGNDTVTTSTFHRKKVTTYSGQSGTDTINLVFTPDQLSHFSAKTIAAIANYLESPTGKTLNSSNQLRLGFKAKDFEQATANVLLDGQLYDISDYLGTINRVVSMMTAYYTDSNSENSLLIGTSAADTINTGGLQNIIFGGAGDDSIMGGAGSDGLFGCSGSDTFIFNNPSEGIDAIADFDITADTIQVSRAGFADIGEVGRLTEERFVVAGSAGTMAQRFIYNNLTGGLFYDSNGSLDGGMTQIAQMSAGLALTHNHFRVGF